MIGIIACMLTAMLVGSLLYRQGVKDGLAAAEHPRELAKVLPVVKHGGAVVEAPEVERLNTIMQNIDAYDGSSKGQREVV